ncbi:ATP-binding protein [Streptomyces sp. NPDC045431]|uniref:ATP-binding protein n=1 Tax=Streptomyces sp. NPDC045431 TaxID=3155613 RepID=UPI0033CAB4FB
MNHKITELPSSPCHFSVRLSPTPRGARLARLLATERLHAWDLPYGVAETAAQLVAELAANAVTHGKVPGRDFVLELRTTDGDKRLRVEVTDTRGDRLPRRSETGHGLVLVEAFADRWGVTEGPVPRKTVWAEIGLVPAPGNPDSGGSGGLPKTKEPERKNPNQTPPLPPAGRPHSPE